MDHLIFDNSQDCQCQYSTASCCQFECCCPCMYYIHGPANINPNCTFNNCHSILFPKQTIKYKKSIKRHSTFTNKDTKNTNSIYTDEDISNDYFPISNYINKDEDFKYKTEDKNTIVNIEDDLGDHYIIKKMKINKNKSSKLSSQSTHNKQSKQKQNQNKNQKLLEKINKNKCTSLIFDKKNKPKYINNLDLNKNSSERLHKTSINKKSVDDIRKYNNRRLNLTENLEDVGGNSNFLKGNKFRMSDLNDDILENKQNYNMEENNENKIALQNLKKEIDKANYIIDNLQFENKTIKASKNEIEQNENLNFLKKENEELNILKKENEKLKKIIYEREQNLVIKINKSTNTPSYNDRERKKEKEEQNIIQRELFEKEVYNLKTEISEITDKLNKYEKFISLLKKKNNEQDMIIKNKDKEIEDLTNKLRQLENENKNKLNELSIKNDEMLKESLNISTDLKTSNYNLKLELEKMKEILTNKNMQIKELEIKLKYDKKFESKKQKLLEILFNFYLNLKKVINIDKNKESLRNLVEVVPLDDFQTKLNNVEKKFVQIIDDVQIKYGHCLACDIACCTSHVDKLKTFRKVNPKKK